MQKRIYWMLGAALVLILVVVGLKSFNGDSEKGTHMVEHRNFKIEEIEEVSKVFIADRTGFTTKLEKQKDGTWLLDGKYEAYNNAVDNLLDAIENIEMQFIPANASVPTIVRNLASEGIHVEIFDRSGDKIKGYYIGGSTSDERGTYAILEESEQPYVVHIPGWTGNIRFRYNLVDQEWRNKKMFFTPVENIKLISVEYPTRRNRSFVLEKEGDKYFVGPYYETGQPRREVSRGRAEQYLVNFESSYLAEHQNRDLEGKSAAIARLPFAIVRLEDSNGKQKDIKFFPRIDERYDQMDPNTDAYTSSLGEKGYDLLMNQNADFAVASSAPVNKFLWTYENF